LVMGVISTLCIIFFFQAEDGIRDWSVTGVQTCALPIFSACDKDVENRQQNLNGVLPILYVFIARADKSITNVTFGSLNGNGAFRSEERRVGKECRSRWWAYD